MLGGSAGAQTFNLLVDTGRCATTLLRSFPWKRANAQTVCLPCSTLTSCYRFPSSSLLIAASECTADCSGISPLLNTTGFVKGNPMVGSFDFFSFGILNGSFSGFAYSASIEGA